MNVNVVPGELTNGTGRVCIHLFVRDVRGPIMEPHVLHPALDEQGAPIKRQLVALPTRGRLACDPRRTVAPVNRSNVTTVTPRTDDPRAVTCPRCQASAEYKALMSEIQSHLRG